MFYTAVKGRTVLYNYTCKVLSNHFVISEFNNSRSFYFFDQIHPVRLFKNTWLHRSKNSEMTPEDHMLLTADQ